MTPATTSITMTRSVAAAPERVYAAWLDPTLLATWWWPHLPDTTYEVDARAGGRYRFRSDRAGIGVHGTIVGLDAPRHLELTWVWEDGDTDGPEERVVVDISAEGDGSLVRVEHVLDPRLSGADDFRQGWTDCLARLGRLA